MENVEQTCNTDDVYQTAAANVMGQNGLFTF